MTRLSNSTGLQQTSEYTGSLGIEITPELENLVHGIFAGGQFASETEVISTALQLLQHRERLRSDLQQGIDELDRGERLDAESVFAELRQCAAKLDERST